MGEVIEVQLRRFSASTHHSQHEPASEGRSTPLDGPVRTQDKIYYLASEAAVDVIVKPTGPGGSAWALKDRLGRNLGAIYASTDAYAPFTISPEGALVGIPWQHASLDAAMTAIAQKMHGTCELDSGDRE